VKDRHLLRQLEGLPGVFTTADELAKKRKRRRTPVFRLVGGEGGEAWEEGKNKSCVDQSIVVHLHILYGRKEREVSCRPNPLGIRSYVGEEKGGRGGPRSLTMKERGGGKKKPTSSLTHL